MSADCVPNIMSLGACLKKFTSLMIARAYIVKIGVIFRRPVWKTKSWWKANLHENWNMQTDFWIFLPKIIKIDLYNSQLHTVSKLLHFWDTV